MVTSNLPFGRWGETFYRTRARRKLLAKDRTD